MGTITLQTPTLGASDATEEPKIVSNFNVLQALLNGNVDTNNLSASAGIVGTQLSASANIAATQLAAAVQQLLFAPGDVKTTAKTAADTGWLMCDGSAVSRTTFASLFRAIGTTYGVGDGASTFNLPDLRGRAVVAPDNMGTGAGAAGRLPNSNRSVGQAGGAELHAHGAGSYFAPDHAHGIAFDGAHGHSIQGSNLGTRSNYTFGSGSQQQGAYLQNTSPATAPIDSAGGHSHGGATAGSGNLGLGGSSSNASAMQPYQVLNYVIKT